MTATGTIIDASSWQHPTNEPIDWVKVKEDGIVGAIIKATQGTTYKNPWFIRDYEGARTAGLIVGAYHFAEPSSGTPEQEAAYFADAIVGLALGLGTFYDLEVSGGQAPYELGPRWQAFCTAVGTPQSPCGLYVNLDMAKALGNASIASRLWLANPSNDETDLKPWLIQTGQSDVSGIVGPVDRDLLTSTRGLNLPLPEPAPPTPAPAPVDPQGDVTLRQGSVGVDVAELQERLDAWHPAAKVAVDSEFGPLTEDAVRLFQRGAGLTDDGIVGPLTWAKLREVPPAPSPAPTPPVVPPVGDRPTIEQGSAGDAVRAAQEALNAAGAKPPLTVDGVFGPKTHTAVVLYQAGHRLTADGIIGPDTWAALAA